MLKNQTNKAQLSSNAASTNGFHVQGNETWNKFEDARVVIKQHFSMLHIDLPMDGR